MQTGWGSSKLKGGKDEAHSEAESFWMTALLLYIKTILDFQQLVRRLQQKRHGLRWEKLPVVSISKKYT
ncbi:MAG TPA: hypothetical protein VIJ57_09410 [Hanamia sp.]